MLSFQSTDKIWDIIHFTSSGSWCICCEFVNCDNSSYESWDNAVKYMFEFVHYFCGQIRRSRIYRHPLSLHHFVIFCPINLFLQSQVLNIDAHNSTLERVNCFHCILVPSMSRTCDIGVCDFFIVNPSTKCKPRKTKINQVYYLCRNGIIKNCNI